MGQDKILIVEDEALSAIDLHRILEKIGYAAQITTSGEEAVELAGKEVPAVVLMDINIHGKMDGIQAAEKIGLAFGIPVIFMTGYNDEEIVAKTRHINPQAILSKPLDIEILKSAIKSAIEKSG